MSHIKQIIREEILIEGFFKDLVKKSFKRGSNHTIEEKAQYIDEIVDELKNYSITPGGPGMVRSKKGAEYPASSPQGRMIIINKAEYTKIIDLLEQILFSKKNDALNFDLFSRNVKNILIKKGDKAANTIKYLEKVLDSLKSREALPKNLPAEEFYEPEEEEISRVPAREFVKEKYALQVELLKMQEWLKKSGKSVIIVFEGRDTAGKGSTIRKFVEHLDPKFYKIVTKGIPTQEERKNWFQRYESDIEPGKIIFFDRSWYNRGIVEPVMGYASKEEYEYFMSQVNNFESKLVSEGNVLIKFWLSITKETQSRRFRMRQTSPLKYWKYSETDARAQEKWEEYTKYKTEVIKLTSTPQAPWIVVDSNDKRLSGLNAMRYVLNTVPYEGKDESKIMAPYPEVLTKID